MDLSVSRLASLLVAPVAFIALFALGSSSCSLLFVTEPPPNHQRLPYFDCTSSRLAPVIDTVLATTYGLAAAGTLSVEPNSTQAVLPLVALAGGLVASAVVGFRQTEACRDAKAELTERLIQRNSMSALEGAGAAAPPVDPWLNPGPAMGARQGPPLPVPPPGQNAIRPQPVPAPTTPNGGTPPSPPPPPARVEAPWQ